VLPEENDAMGRSWVGWASDLSPQSIYDANRGLWLLGARADKERYAVFSSTELGEIVCVVELTAPPESFGAKKAVVGTVLGPGNPVHDALIGTPAPDSFRNPVTYVDDPDGPTRCACGCGTEVSGRSQFVVGHDQRAVHARITAQWGNTVAFLQWFDTTYGRPPAA
jgi:hypothetical protein